MTRKKTGQERENRLRAIGDITDCEPAERALQELEEQWRSLVENIPDIMMTVDADGTILFINHTVPGLTVEGTIGTSVYDYVPPENHDTLRKFLGRVFETGEAHSYEISGAGPFGRASWYFSRIGPIMRNDGVVAAVLVTTDITEQRRVEEALRESEERFRRLAQDSIDGIVIGEGSEIRFVNSALLNMFGYQSEEEMVGRSFTDFVSPECCALLLERNRARERGQVVPARYEFKALRKDGSTFDVEASVSGVGYQGRVITQAVVRDITERKRAAEALRASEERYRDLVENINDVIYEVDTSGRVTYISPVAEGMGGYSPSEIVGRPWVEFLHPDDYSTAIEGFQRSVSGDMGPHEYRLVSKSGEIYWVRSFSRPIFEGDRVAGLRGVLTNITERRLAEEALRESEKRYRDLVELSPDAMVVHSSENILFVNSAGVQLFGAAAADQIIGRPIWDFVHPCNLKAVRRRIQSAWPKRKKADLVEEKLVRLDGQVIDVEMAAIPITYRGNAARQVVFRDITERKRMEEALQSAREELENTVERQMQRGSAYGLSFRELTVLHLIANGKSDREIGAMLGISTLTARKHVENILAKMRASCRTEASVRATREGLLD